MRGFWGDIINSPYMSWGNEVDDEEHRLRFYKSINYQTVYTNADVSEYNVHRVIHKFQTGEEYEFPFERLKHILGDQYNKPGTGVKGQVQKSDKSNAEKKDEKDEEPMIEELTDEQAAEEERKL